METQRCSCVFKSNEFCRSNWVYFISHKGEKLFPKDYEFFIQNL